MNKIFYLLPILLISCHIKNHKQTEKLDQSIDQLTAITKHKNTSSADKIKLLDNLYRSYKGFAKDSLQFLTLTKKANVFYNAGLKDSAFYYDHLLYKQAKSKSAYYQGKAAKNIAIYYKNSQNYDSAFYYFNRSKNHFNQLKDSSQIGRRLMSMGLIQQNKNDFFGSKETIAEALQFLNPTKDQKYIASCYSAQGTNHRKLLNLNEAKKYYLKAIKSTQKKKQQLAYKNNLATVFIQKKEYLKAAETLQNILKDSVLTTTSSQYARVLDNLAYSKWLLGRNIDESEFYVPLQIRKNNGDQRGQISSYTHLGEFYLKNKPLKAQLYLDSVISLSKKIKIPQAEKEALSYLIKLAPKNRKLLHSYVALQDSLYKQELKVKTQFAMYKYEDRLKQEAILRLEKENTEKALEASKQKNQKLISISIIGVLIALLGFYSFYATEQGKRLKKEQETKALQASHKTEAELSRRLHDDFGGKLNQTMVMLQNQIDNEQILDVVESLYNQSRDFSREINEVNTGDSYSQELLEMLKFRTPSNSKLLFTGLNNINWANISDIKKTTIYKVLQELMINMHKHSKADLVSIAFETTKNGLFISYADDGQGASKEELLSKNGLTNTEKRIMAIGGNITFDTAKNEGFRASINLPI